MRDAKDVVPYGKIIKSACARCGRIWNRPYGVKAFCWWQFRFRREQATRPTILRVNKAVG